MRIDNPGSIGTSTGFGVPTGGTVNQILVKNSSTNFDTSWTSSPTLNSLTVTGTTSVKALSATTVTATTLNLRTVSSASSVSNLAIDVSGNIVTGNTPMFVGPSIITSTGGSNPVKGSTTIDKMILTDYGNGMCSIWLNFYQSTAGTAGSGDYLFTLPGGYQFDTTTVGSYPVVGDPGMSGVEITIPGANGKLSSQSSTGQQVTAYAMAWSSTQFRILQGNEAIYGSPSSPRFPVSSSSTFYNMGLAGVGYQIFFMFKKA